MAVQPSWHADGILQWCAPDALRSLPSWPPSSALLLLPLRAAPKLAAALHRPLRLLRPLRNLPRDRAIVFKRQLEHLVKVADEVWGQALL